MERLPKHVAIIMDGNGRWAREHKVSRIRGHEAGAKSVRGIVEECRSLGIEVLSLYTFSTENWRRSKMEVTALFNLLSKYIALETDNLHKEDIRLIVMGQMERLSKRVRKDLRRSMEKTAGNKSMTLNLAINYGGRAEIVDAVKSIVSQVQQGALSADKIDEECIAKHLYTPELPDPDLLIRTSGEMRLSNFMLWQLSYTEIVLTDVLWPDFGKESFYGAIADYQSRARRFGGRR